ncbi:MAG: radical SAM protein, partial [candidate division WWE3 bacterium]|nr:radical SAM protein [candidate division WWE3 bacterium]
MRLGGLQKLTLIDYPGKITATVFTVGCSYSCPFCYNPNLVHPSLNAKEIPTTQFFTFLRKRLGKLEAVCITGGEPTLQPDLTNFIEEIKKVGFLVKLDTNGSRPE